MYLCLTYVHVDCTCTYSHVVLGDKTVHMGTRVFSRGSGGGRRPPPDFGGKRVPPRGGTHFDLGKKGYGGWLGVTRTYPHLGHHVRNPHQKKKGRQGVERARSASYPLPGIIVKRI